MRAELAADGRSSRINARSAKGREQRRRDRGVPDRFGCPALRQLSPRRSRRREAAWSIGSTRSAFGVQRRCLKLLRISVGRGDADPKHAAYLDDRIAFNERRPQKYGTQFDWDQNGEMSPYDVDDFKAVDRRRRTLGMTPFAEHIAHMREQWRKSNERPPADWKARQREIEEGRGVEDDK